MLIYADFDQLNLNELDSNLRAKILSLHNGNESFYKNIQEENLELIKELLILGFPMNWKEALKNFGTEEQIILDNFSAPHNPNSSDCTDDLGICFDNRNRNFDSVFYNKSKIDFNRELVDLLASFYFKREDKDMLGIFMFLYFATAVDKKLVREYINNLLEDKGFYLRCINGLLHNKDSDFFDIFINFKKDKRLKNFSDIFSRPLCGGVLLNEYSYKKAFNLYIDEIIEQKMQSVSVKNTINYNRRHGINEVFSSLYMTDECKNEIYKKYNELTGVADIFTPVAIAYSHIKKLDVFFELEWERLPSFLKDKYPKGIHLSKDNKIRKNNYFERSEKDFKKVFDEFCKNHNLEFIAEQCQLLGVPEKYYPEIYYKNKLENVLDDNDKDKSEAIRKI